MITQTDRDRKQAEYRQSEWMTRRLTETKIETVNKTTGARLVFCVAFGRIFGCLSDQSGEYHDMPAGACACGDSERAMKLGRGCRHAVAWDRVDRHLEAERQAENFREGALNPEKFDQRVEQLARLTEAEAREIEAEHHLVDGEVVEVAA